jgi:uncharacterized membrane protein
MNKMLAIVFADEKTAYEGLRALSALDREGSIDVNSLAVIKKNADGTVRRERVDGQFPGWTLGGTVLGGLIGAAAGPVGLAVGMSAGELAGLFGDLHTSVVDEDFLSEVAGALTPGKYGVLADVEEEWVTPVDTRMEALGGVMFRSVKSDIESERRSREVAARRAELDQLKAEHAKARSDRKAKLQARIDQLRSQLEKKMEQNRAHAKQAEEQVQAKVRALQKKSEQEKDDAKAAIEARITRLRDDYQHRQPA